MLGGDVDCHLDLCTYPQEESSWDYVGLYPSLRVGTFSQHDCSVFHHQELFGHWTVDSVWRWVNLRCLFVRLYWTDECDDDWSAGVFYWFIWTGQLIRGDVWLAGVNPLAGQLALDDGWPTGEDWSLTCVGVRSVCPTAVGPKTKVSRDAVTGIIHSRILWTWWTRGSSLLQDKNKCARSSCVPQ